MLHVQFRDGDAGQRVGGGAALAIKITRLHGGSNSNNGRALFTFDGT